MGPTFTKRDFNYVADTIDAFYKILSCKKLIGKEVNICTQKNISIDKLINEISIILNKKKEFGSIILNDFFVGLVLTALGIFIIYIIYYIAK